MGLALKKNRLFTPEEYVEFERSADVRHEFVDGEVYEMAGESLAHSQICANLIGEMRQALKGSDCQALSPNMKVRAETKGLFAYPDLTIVCGEPQFHDEHRDILLNPRVIFEVLSPSTQFYDRNRKLGRYLQGVTSLTDYVLIYQDSPGIEHYEKRNNGEWILRFVEGLDATFALASVGCQIAMAEIFDRVELRPQELASSD